MNDLFELNMSKQDMINIGKTIGADVPPCLFKRATYVTRNRRKC